MDDWKLKTRPVVRLRRPKKTFVGFAVHIQLLFRHVSGPSWDRIPSDPLPAAGSVVYSLAPGSRERPVAGKTSVLMHR